MSVQTVTPSQPKTASVYPAWQPPPHDAAVATEQPVEPTLPTMYDLPSEDPEEHGVPDLYHPIQAELLSQTFDPPDYPPQNRLVAMDLNLFYDVTNTNWYKRPDWYAVLDVPYLYYNGDLRLSYVRWRERVDPYIIIELLSPATKMEDLGKKKRPVKDAPPTKWYVYERILRVPYYITFDRYTDTLRVFQLQGGVYQEVELSDNRLWIPHLRIGLGLWQGLYRQAERLWLRWYDADGAWFPTEEEQAKTARQQADEAEQQAEAARQQADEAEQRALSAEQKAEALAAKLRALGIDPES